MKPEERLEEVEALIEELREASRLAPVLVEGAKDAAALRRLGVGGRILELNRGDAVFAVCESLAKLHRKVIVLTDWDRKGGQLARLLKEGLAANGVEADLAFRRELARLAHVRTVEGLATWVATLRKAVRASRPEEPE